MGNKLKHKGQRDSIATVYRLRSAKQRQALRKAITAERVLEGISLGHHFQTCPAPWPISVELVSRNKHGGVVRLTGATTYNVEYTLLGIGRHYGGTPYLIPYVQGTPDHYRQVGALLGLDYHGGEELWYFEIDHRAGSNELLAELQSRIVSSIGPYHVTKNGDCIRVRELGGTFGMGADITIEYKAPENDYVTVAGLESYIKGRGNA